MIKTSIMQLGTGRVLHAHGELFVSEAGKAGQNVGPISVVQSSGANLAEIHVDKVNPAFVVAGQAQEFAAYVAMTLARFDNPFLDNGIADIAQSHPRMAMRRIGALLTFARAQGDQTNKPILSDILNNQERAR